jgi:hypothetical protein
VTSTLGNCLPTKKRNNNQPVSYYPPVSNDPASQGFDPKVLIKVAPNDMSGVATGKVSHTRVWRGLLWYEWFAQSKLFLAFLVVWLACVWILPLYTNPSWILFFGVAYALLAGPAYGGSDIMEGCEEFSFALPPTHSDRYLARLVVGGGTVLLFTIMDALALGLDLPQALTRWYVNTGLVKPMPNLEPRFLYGLVFALPFSIFAFAFVLSALSRSRALVLTAWFWGGLATLVCLRLGLHYESFYWEEWNGYFACPFLIVLGIIVIYLGYRSYRYKEIGRQFGPVTIPTRWWIWMIVIILCILLALALVSSLIEDFTKLPK